MALQVSWLTLVLGADPDHYQKDVAYRFSDGSEFLSTDMDDSGIYE